MKLKPTAFIPGTALLALLTIICMIVFHHFIWWIFGVSFAVLCVWFAFCVSREEDAE